MIFFKIEFSTNQLDTTRTIIDLIKIYFAISLDCRDVLECIRTDLVNQAYTSHYTLRVCHSSDCIWIQSRDIIDTSASIVLKHLGKRRIGMFISASLKVVLTV